ncbi:hypothetical protein [Shimia sp.]|uniref:hypothetical protein n=1 Tax=Shimia sp. TaxID=1954381 RepID=UPI003BAAE2E3
MSGLVFISSRKPRVRYGLEYRILVAGLAAISGTPIHEISETMDLPVSTVVAWRHKYFPYVKRQNVSGRRGGLVVPLVNLPEAFRASVRVSLTNSETVQLTYLDNTHKLTPDAAKVIVDTVAAVKRGDVPLLNKLQPAVIAAE